MLIIDINDNNQRPNTKGSTKDLKEKRIEERNRYEATKETIVKTAVMTIFEKLNAKLYALHEAWNFLYLVVNNVHNDSKVAKPTYQKWISRMDKLKSI